MLNHQISKHAMEFSTKKLRRYRFILECIIKTCFLTLEGQNTKGSIDFILPKAS